LRRTIIRNEPHASFSLDIAHGCVVNHQCSGISRRTNEHGIKSIAGYLVAEDAWLERLDPYWLSRPLNCVARRANELRVVDRFANS